MTDDKSREQMLKARVASERAAAGRRRVRFSPWVRREAVELAVASGVPRDRFSQEMGIGKTSLRKWIRAAQSSGAARRGEGARFRPVKVQSSTEPASGNMLAIVFPSGARLVGLSVAELRQLLGVTA
jgi:transposase-like protein